MRRSLRRRIRLGARLPLTLAVIGDSHADPLIGATVRDAGTNEVLAVAQVVHIPGLLASEFLDPAGRIQEKVAIALVALRFVVYAGEGATDAVDTAILGPNLYSPSWSTSWRVNTGWRGVPLLFLAGELSARSIIAAIPVHADVEGFFAPDELAGVPRFVPTAKVSAESIRSVVAGQLAPMFTAVRLLRDLGIGPIVLHSLPSPTTDDALYQAETGRDTRALTRTKIVLLFNAEMRAFAARERFHFIDRWDAMTTGGIARDGYLRDAVHLGNEHARATLLDIYRTLLPTDRTLIV